MRRFSNTSSPVRAVLTTRELQVVEAVVDGLSNREIARRCRISEQTVKNHLTHAYLKLGVRGRVQLLVRLIGAKKQ